MTQSTAYVTGQAHLEHVLSSCSTSLTQGRYRWTHDAVLRELADWLEMRERRKVVVTRNITNLAKLLQELPHSKHQS